MAVDLKNLDYIRQANEWTPDLGAKMAELLQNFAQGVNNLEQQTNGNTQGSPQPPGKINGFNVTSQNGHFSVEISDHNEIYRGVRYFVEHADNPHFTNPVTEDLGTSRNRTFFMGNVTRYWRAYSAYPNSAPGEAVYHGSQTQPTAVTGGGDNAGGPTITSQGSGTGAAGQGLQGPGSVPFRTTSGAPPTR